MNEFTKGELDEIFRLALRGSSTLGEDDCILDKIQSVINCYGKTSFTPPDDMDSSALAWRYNQDE